MNKFIKLALTSIVALTVVASMSYAGAPNGWDLATSINITNINVPETNSAGNAASFLPANPRRIGLLVIGSTAAGVTNSGSTLLDYASNAVPNTAVATIAASGTYTNFVKPVYQGNIWFNSTGTNYAGITTNGIRVIEFQADSN